MSDVNEVNAPSAKQLLDSGALLLDVRTPQEFAKGHVEGAAPSCICITTLPLNCRLLSARLGECSDQGLPERRRGDWGLGGRSQFCCRADSTSRSARRAAVADPSRHHMLCRTARKYGGRRSVEAWPFRVQLGWWSLRNRS